MPNLTENLGLNTWLENEVVDFEQINENFEKIDKLVVGIESGTETASFSGGSETTATWKYRKYSDGTVELNTKLNLSSILCDGGSAAPYYTDTATVYLPFTLTSIHNVQTQLVSTHTMGWVANVTGVSVLDSVAFRVLSIQKETSSTNKYVYISVKGAIS